MQKLVFDVKNRPELAVAIIERLLKLGYREPSGSNQPGTYVNVSIGYANKENQIHCGQCVIDNIMWENYKKLTLNDLYDEKRWLSKEKKYIVRLGSQKVAISKEMYKEIQALAEEQD